MTRRPLPCSHPIIDGGVVGRCATIKQVAKETIRSTVSVRLDSFLGMACMACQSVKMGLVEEPEALTFCAEPPGSAYFVKDRGGATNMEVLRCQVVCLLANTDRQIHESRVDAVDPQRYPATNTASGDTSSETSSALLRPLVLNGSVRSTSNPRPGSRALTRILQSHFGRFEEVSSNTRYFLPRCIYEQFYALGPETAKVSSTDLPAMTSLTDKTCANDCLEPQRHAETRTNDLRLKSFCSCLALGR